MPRHVETFFDPTTWTLTHVLHAGVGTACAIVDSVLDYDPKSGRTSTASADRVVAYVREHQLQVQWILETHAHADHLSAAPYLRDQLGGKIAIGEHIKHVQGAFKDIFNLEPEFKLDGSQFDHLFTDGEVIEVGALRGEVMHVPGHTPACVAYRFDDIAFVGDTIFAPDVGTARCDFPGGSAETLYQSMQRLLQLPDATTLYLCHDYPPNERAVQSHTTVGAQRQGNIHVGNSTPMASFVKMRSERDATLAMPVLILPSVQVNIRAGELPPAEDNGTRYLKIPLNAV